MPMARRALTRALPATLVLTGLLALGGNVGCGGADGTDGTDGARASKALRNEQPASSASRAPRTTRLPEPVDPDTRARTLYREGQAAYQEGRYREAMAAFENAYELRPLAPLLFNVAQCHRKLGQCEQAAEYYQRFLAAQPDSGMAEQIDGYMTGCQQRSVPRCTPGAHCL